MTLVDDCNDLVGGAAVTSGDCGDCWCVNTGLPEDWNNTDGDSFCNFGSANGEEDNCPNTTNEDQADNDNDSGNGVDDGDDATGGDACDNDDDNDDDDDDNNVKPEILTTSIILSSTYIFILFYMSFIILDWI